MFLLTPKVEVEAHSLEQLVSLDLNNVLDFPLASPSFP